MSKFVCECGNRKPANRSRCNECAKIEKAASKGNMARIERVAVSRVIDAQHAVESMGFELHNGMTVKPPVNDQPIETPIEGLAMEIEIIINDEGRLELVQPINVEPRFNIEAVMGDDQPIVGFNFEDYMGGDAKPVVTWAEMEEINS